MAINFKHRRPAKPEQDKAVFELMRAMRGMRTCDIYKKLPYHLANATIYKIRNRRTRYPSHMTCAAIAAALGMKYELVPAHESRAQKVGRVVVEGREERASA